MARLRGSINNDSITGFGGRDRLSGRYGDDTLAGGQGDDRLNGGRGSDTVQGGDGNDVIVSRSDAGEAVIAQDINANNDPNGEVNANARMIYANQAGMSADDVLTGGAGADQFRIETLIGAKRDILLKHTDPNTGIIDYHGVAGENNLVHDHWVDSIGNDIITDFNKAEGDTLSIKGHTTEVYKIDIVDADGDGQADDSVLHLRSNQGAGGGAHNLDLLGTVTVLNNEMTANDFATDAGQHYGIVRNAAQIEEAINPLNPNAPAGTAPSAGAGNPVTGSGRLNGTVNDDNITGQGGRDRIAGGYGDDKISGQGGDDRLNGGRGNDTVQGGEGNDVIVSRSDAGEAVIAQDINANNDPNGEVNADARMIYANQAGMAADDVLTGGAGADQFRIETLIGAKRDILLKHTDPNTGVINYHGVAGENNLVHDHWVDSIGNDVITDFNKAEGDTLSIKGHTTEVYKIDITDADGDGQADDSVLHLRSNQGANGGAHHLDLLGTVTVLNNEMTANDFTTDAGQHYGIVRNAARIEEAINPRNTNAGTGTDAGTGGDTGAGAGDGAGGGTGTDTGGDTGAGTGANAGSGTGGQTGGGTGAGTGTGSGDGHDHGTGTGTGTDASAGGGTGAGAGGDTGAGAGAGAGTGTGTSGGGTGAGTGTGAGDGHDHGTGSGAGTGTGTGTGTDGDTGAGTGTGTVTPAPNPLAALMEVPADAVAGAAPTSGDDVLLYAAGNDKGNGGMGNDLLVGLEGDDSLSGGWGDDRIDAGAGNDHVHGGHGSDLIAGLAGDDLITGDLGDDILVGGDGADTVRGGRGEDVLFGGAGNDKLNAGAGGDIVMAGAGADTVDGGSGTDALLLTGAIGDYTITVGANDVQFTDANGETDVVSRVEQFRFLGTGETYVVENGALALTTDTADLDELLADHMLEELIASEAAGGEAAPADAADAPAADAPAAPVADAPAAAEAASQASLAAAAGEAMYGLGMA